MIANNLIPHKHTHNQKERCGENHFPSALFHWFCAKDITVCGSHTYTHTQPQTEDCVLEMLS